MSEVKIYKSNDGSHNYIYWNRRMVHLRSNIKVAEFDSGPFHTHYSVEGVDFLTKAEARAACDELVALLEQAKKQIAEQDAKEGEIEAARELLSDGKRVSLFTHLGAPTFLFNNRAIGVGDDFFVDVTEIKAVGETFCFGIGVGKYYFHTREKAEKMRQKLIDKLARAKAQLLLEEVGD